MLVLGEILWNLIISLGVKIAVENKSTLVEVTSLVNEAESYSQFFSSDLKKELNVPKSHCLTSVQ